MKKLHLLIAITIISLILSCNSAPQTIATLKVLKWGPENAKLGEIPNKQPNGNMGIWIDVSSTEGLGELQIIFDGTPKTTVVQPKLLTTGIPFNELNSVGDKKIEIKQLSTGEIIPVGVFKVTTQ